MEKEMKFDHDTYLRNILDSHQRQLDILERRLNRLSQTILLLLVVILAVLYVKNFL